MNYDEIEDIVNYPPRESAPYWLQNERYDSFIEIDRNIRELSTIINQEDIVTIDDVIFLIDKKPIVQQFYDKDGNVLRINTDIAAESINLFSMILGIDYDSIKIIEKKKVKISLLCIPPLKIVTPFMLIISIKVPYTGFYIQNPTQRQLIFLYEVLNRLYNCQISFSIENYYTYCVKAEEDWIFAQSTKYDKQLKFNNIHFNINDFQYLSMIKTNYYYNIEQIDSFIMKTKKKYLNSIK